MGSVIAKTPNKSGVHRFIDRVDETNFSEEFWQRNPDISKVKDYSKRYWAYDGTPVVVVHTPEIRKAIDIEQTVEQNEFANVELSWRGYVKNRWLKTGAGLGIDTHRHPHILRGAGHINALTFSNYYNKAGGDIEIYFDRKKVHTFEVRDSRYATKTSQLSGLDFAPGTLLSVFFRSVNGQRASWVTLNIEYKYTILTKEDGAKPSL